MGAVNYPPGDPGGMICASMAMEGNGGLSNPGRR